MDEIHPDMFRILDVMELSWLTGPSNVVWAVGTVLLFWQIGGVVTGLKEGDWRVCIDYQGITLL